MESAFRDAADVELIETFAWDGAQFPRIDRHFERLGRSAARMGRAFNRQAAQDLLRAQVTSAVPQRMRLTLNAQNQLSLQTYPLGPSPQLWRVALAQERLCAQDPWLSLKSTRRATHDRARASLPAGIDEYLFLNERDELCEGTITTVFFDLGAGLSTPPLSVGALPGVLRAQMLAEGRVREAVLHRDQLPQAQLWLGNSLRGFWRAELV